MGTIDSDIRTRVLACIDEMNTVIKERSEVIHGAWVARIAQEHLLMLGPGGTGKSFLVRDLVSHISDAVHFEVALDETTDPGQVFGPPDIKAMVEKGRTRRVTEAMLPEATDAFVDEIFNGNSPVLHGLMPILNERIFHNNGLPSPTPLRSLYAGTNKLTADADLAAFFDRLHIRYVVDYVSGRASQSDMVTQAIARMTAAGRGTTTSIATARTTLTLAELDLAHAQALALDVEDALMTTFLDVREELSGNGVVVSDRRMVEGMAAVLANAWIRGHGEVKTEDLDILAAMWWTTQDQIPTTRSIVLAVANPGEKAAMELLDELDKLKAEGKRAEDLDPDRRIRVGIEIIRNTDRLIREAAENRDKALAAGHPTARLDETIQRGETFKEDIGRALFGLDSSAMVAVAGAAR